MLGHVSEVLMSVHTCLHFFHERHTHGLEGLSVDPVALLSEEFQVGIVESLRCQVLRVVQVHHQQQEKGDQCFKPHLYHKLTSPGCSYILFPQYRNQNHSSMYVTHPDKISLSQVIRNHPIPTRQVQSPPHITIQPPLTPKKSIRHKIFPPKEHEQSKLRKVASQGRMEPTEDRIEQINRQLRQRRQGNGGGGEWTGLQKSIAESRECLKRQQQWLANQMPIFQQKIDENSHAIGQVGQLLRDKMHEDSQRNETMMQILAHRSVTGMAQAPSVEQPSLQQEEQLLRSRHQNRQNELELQRIRRVQALQEGNLQLYQQQQQQEQEQNRREQVWGESSSFSGERISKISLKGSHGGMEANTTIGELLSPLWLQH